MKRFSLTCILFGLLLSPALHAQTAAPAVEPEWNGERALELIRRAQARRAEATADTALLSYQADARGHLYFYLDRPDRATRNLVKTDQIALEVFWREPDLAKQRIVGWRDRKSLPTNIRYHIDHLAVVLENFGDLIRIGDGDEVQDVLHPAAPGAERFYEYRLADSLTLRLPGATEPVRVYELKVRPRDLSQPGLVGSVFVDRRAGDLVRMDFTFTPSAYRDRYLDYINISLDNGLWKGRFWLPNAQRVEIRRELPELDIPVGSVIRGTLRVGNYRFNEELPLQLFVGAPVALAPAEDREAFVFEQELDAELREEGLGPEVELEEVRREAIELARGRVLSGLRSAGGVEPRFGSASEVLRYNRAEGATVGLGVGITPTPHLSLGAQAGWAFGAEHPLLEAQAEWRGTSLGLSASGYLNQSRDIGIGPVASGAINSLSALFAGEDYRDLFYASGISLRGEWRMAPNHSTWLALRAEKQSSAELETDFSIFGGGSPFRPVHAIDRAEPAWSAELGWERRAPAEISQWWEADASAKAGMINPAGDLILIGCLEPDGVSCAEVLSATFLRARGEATWSRYWNAVATTLDVTGAGGFALGELPRQELFLLGGRGTVPGYPFRAFGGDRFLLGRATASVELVPVWLRGRGIVAAGWAGVGGVGREALARWGAEPTGTFRPSVGVGVGIFYDILHLDLARGLGDDGVWEFVIEVQRSFWDFL